MGKTMTKHKPTTMPRKPRPEPDPIEALDEPMPDLPEPDPIVEAPAAAPKVRRIVLELPYAPVTAGYEQRHIDVLLSHRQATAMRHVFDGLQASATKLRNGKFVQSTADAIRWLTEQVEDEAVPIGGES